MLFNFPSISLTKIAIVTPAKTTLIAQGAERTTKIIVKISCQRNLTKLQ